MDECASAGDEGSLPAALCFFCGEPERLEIADIFTDSNFILDTCCSTLLEVVAADMQDDPEWARDLLRRLGAEALTGRRLRRVCDGEGGTPMLDYKLEVRPISFRDACAFVARHHAHCKPPTCWRWGSALYNGFSLIGVVMVGNPVAPAFMHRGTVEVNRLTVRRDLPRMLRDGACSKLYSESARIAERKGFARIISYTRSDENGASLRAAGWVCDGPVRGRSWHSARRQRSNANALVNKYRWSRTLRPKPAKPPTAAPSSPAALPDWMGGTRPQTSHTLC